MIIFVLGILFYLFVVTYGQHLKSVDSKIPAPTREELEALGLSFNTPPPRTDGK